MTTRDDDDQEAYFDDRDEPVEKYCERCDGDGMDPWNDYLLPCPECRGDGFAL